MLWALLGVVWCLATVGGAFTAESPGDVINHIRQLRQNSMIVYDKMVRPTIAMPGPDTPDLVKVGMYLDRIWEVDPMAETFKIEGYLRLSWKDPRLSFNVSDSARHRFHNSRWLPTWWNGADAAIPGIIIDAMTDSDVVGMLWDPVLFISNSVNGKGVENTAGSVMIAGDGTVYRSVRFVDQLSAPFDFRWFPFDKQALLATVEIYYYSRNDVTLKWATGMDIAGTELDHCDAGVTSVSEWDLDGPEFSYGEDFVSSSGGTRYQKLTLVVPATRHPYMWQRSYIWPSMFIVLLSFMGLLLEPTTEMRCGMHVIALLTQVTLLSSLMDSMPSIGYLTWMEGWAVDMMVLTGLMLMECIVAAYAKHRIQAARAAAMKKNDAELGRTHSMAAARSELRLPTSVLVLGELDTIARACFPSIFISNTLLKELQLAQEPRTDSNGVVYAFIAIAFCGCAGVLAWSVRKIVDRIGLRRDAQGGSTDQEKELTDNPLKATLHTDSASDSA